MNYPSFKYMETDQGTLAHLWVSIKLRIYAQGLCASPVFKSRDYSNSQNEDMSTWPYSTKTAANSREQEKTKQNRVGFPFFILYSPRTANATFECFSSLNEKKKGGGESIYVQRKFF